MTIKYIMPILVLILTHSLAHAGEPFRTSRSIKSIRSIFVDSGGGSQSIVEMEYLILTEAGRSDHAYERVQFSGATDTFELLEASSAYKSTVSRVRPHEVVIKSISSAAVAIENLKEATIPLSHLQVGSRVRVKYKISSRPMLAGVFNLALSKQDLSEIGVVRIDSALPLYFYQDDNSFKFSVRKTRANGRTLAEIQLVKPAGKAPLDGRRRLSFALVSSAATWSALNGHIAPTYLAAIDEPLPIPFQKIVDAAAQLKDPRRQIEYSSSEISRLISYAGNWQTVKQMYFPQGHKNVLRGGKGDCKDFATTMVAILRQLGIASYPALTFRSISYLGQERLERLRKFPSIVFFNHVIVWARDPSGKVWWVDPTNPLVLADTLTADILGNFSLILDGRANQAELLPSQNPHPADITLEQTISINGDNSVSGRGTLLLTPSSYNQVALNEKSFGLERTKEMLSSLINIGSKISIQVDKSAESFSYTYSFRANDWMQEQSGKYRVLVKPHVALALIPRFESHAEIDLGEIGTTKLVSIIKNQKELDSIQAGCLIRSKWVDIDRVVENRTDDIRVIDSIVIKTRNISETATHGDEFEALYRDIQECGQNSKLVFFMSPTLISQKSLDFQKMKGPPVEVMTDEDAKKLDEVGGPEHFRYVGAKLYRYYSRKIESRPSDAESYFNRSDAIMKLGYLSGDEYVRAYADEGLNDVDMAIKLSTPVKPEYLVKKILILLRINKIQDAISVFNHLLKNYKAVYFTYAVGAEIAIKTNDFQKAEQWLLLAKNLIKTDEHQSSFHRLMPVIYEKQNRYQEAIPHLEYFINNGKKDPWTIHNLARGYYLAGSYEKAIQLERQALEGFHFGAARNVLTLALVRTAERALTQVQGRTLASTESNLSEIESNLLEAIKWTPDQKSANYYLAGVYYTRFQHSRNPEFLEKGRPYLEKALQVQSDDPDAVTLEKLYANAGKK